MTVSLDMDIISRNYECLEMKSSYYLLINICSDARACSCIIFISA